MSSETSSRQISPDPGNSDNYSGSKWKKYLKRAGLGTIIFFTIKGIITSSIIIGAALGVRSCF